MYKKFSQTTILKTESVFSDILKIGSIYLNLSQGVPEIEMWVMSYLWFDILWKELPYPWSSNVS